MSFLLYLLLCIVNNKYFVLDILDKIFKKWFIKNMINN
jgi:hypothetical protein